MWKLEHGLHVAFECGSLAHGGHSCLFLKAPLLSIPYHELKYKICFLGVLSLSPLLPAPCPWTSRRLPFSPHTHQLLEDSSHCRLYPFPNVLFLWQLPIPVPIPFTVWQALLLFKLTILNMPGFVASFQKLRPVWVTPTQEKLWTSGELLTNAPWLGFVSELLLGAGFFSSLVLSISGLFP